MVVDIGTGLYEAERRRKCQIPGSLRIPLAFDLGFPNRAWEPEERLHQAERGGYWRKVYWVVPYSSPM